MNICAFGADRRGIKMVGEYELTAVGHKRLEGHRHKIATGVYT
jgi:hypothetical protein